jgi:ABC-2 type transport system ATP-binding protein
VVGSPTPEPLRAALAAAGLAVDPLNGQPSGLGGLRVRGATPAQVGSIAFRAGIELHELRQEDSDLEAIFLALTTDTDGGVPDVATAPMSAPVPARTRHSTGQGPTRGSTGPGDAR